MLEGRKLALFVTTFPPDESHNFVLVQVFRVVKPAPGVGGGGLLKRKPAFLDRPRGSRRHSFKETSLA